MFCAKRKGNQLSGEYKEIKVNGQGNKRRGNRGNRRGNNPKFLPVRCAVLLALSCAGVWAGNQLAGISPAELFPFWMWPLSAACCWACVRFFSLEPSREKTAALVLSFCFLLAQLVGRQYDFRAPPGGGPTAGGLLRWGCYPLCAAALAPALALPAAAGLRMLSGKARSSVSEKIRPGRTFGICLLVLFLLWLPYHLAYFPALAEYDSGYQLWQNWNHRYSATNPLLHTFILGFFYLNGERFVTVNAGLALFSLVQRLFMASCIAWTLTVLRRNGMRRGLLAALLLFFGLLPVFPMLAISMTKDVPFYCLVLVQLVLIYDGCRHTEKMQKWRYWIALTAVTALACLFRANALGVMFVIPPLVCLACANRSFRRCLLCFMLIGTLLAAGINAVMIAAVGAEKTELRENFSLPIIQLARVTYFRENARKDLEENYTDVVEMPMAYIPYVADLSKWQWKLDRSNLGRFAEVWAKWGAACPREYLDAALLLNRGYWYLGDQTFTKVYGTDPDYHLGVIPSRVSPNIETIVQECWFPWLYGITERLYSGNEYLNIPVYRLLLSPALYTWMLLYLFGATLCQKRRDTRAAIRAAFLYLAGLLLGPCCILRYALLFFLFSPVLLGMLTTNPAEEAGKDIKISLFRRSRQNGEKKTGKGIRAAGNPG